MWPSTKQIIISLSDFYNLMWIILSLVEPPRGNSPGLWSIYVIRSTVHQGWRSGSLCGSAVRCFTTKCPCVQMWAAAAAPEHTHISSLPRTARCSKLVLLFFLVCTLHLSSGSGSRMCIVATLIKKPKPALNSTSKYSVTPPICRPLQFAFFISASFSYT